MFRCMPFFACNRQVDSLDKRQCNLNHIPEEVARYARSLEELMLDSNHIKELSKPLFRLVKLRRLQLSDNEIYRIPPDISSLSNLVELDLSKNDVSDIPDNIKFCKNLRALNLGSNPITRLPASITQLRTLTQLGLSDVSLTQLPADIGNLSNLRELELRDNLLRHIPESISYLAQLQRLDLGCNELSELPLEVGQLTSLQEFYIDGNDFDILPQEIGYMKALQVLDVSECKLELIPEEIGELTNLSDLVLSANCLESLPHSIGRLKKLNILKVDRNRLTELTPAIGSCTGLQELILTENLLSEIPSSIANLRQLSNLNVDKNSLDELPSTIGSCTNLGVLSLRDNKLMILPMEVGKLEKLRVLDVSGNRLTYLPFTIGVLSNLQALWLSENQSQPLLKLQQDEDTRTGMKVLTCYLLPQKGSPPPGFEYQVDESRKATDGPVGGPNVHFADEPSADDEDKLPIGNFSRHDTPHPKHPKPDKSHIDGNLIHHHEMDDMAGAEAPGAVSLDLNARRQSQDTAHSQESPRRVAPEPPPRQHSRITPSPHQSRENISGAPLADLGDEDGEEVDGEMGGRGGGGGVNFASDTEDKDGKESRLKRKNTPHYLKYSKLGDAGTAQAKLAEIMSDASTQGHNASSSSHAASNGPTTADVLNGSRTPDLARSLVTQYEEQIKLVHRMDGGLGLSIAGGTDSPPYNPDKPEDEGIFISKITEAGPADRVGLKRGDKLLAVNGNSTVGISHKQAVEYMKRAGDAVSMKIGRSVLKPQSAFHASEPRSPDTGLTSESEIVSTTIRVGSSGPGFNIAGGKGAPRFKPSDDGIYVSYIYHEGPADRDGKLRVGDRILAINGTNVREGTYDRATALLSGYDNEVHLVVQRDRTVTTPHAPLTPLKSQESGKLQAFGDLEPPLAQSSPVASLQRNTAPPTPSSFNGSNPLNDSLETSPYPVETVTIKKVNGSLGLSIVGGSDHSHHPFGNPGPGVFVSKLVPGGGAAKSKKLRIGDRLLSVNGTDVSVATHDAAVQCLKASTGKEVVLKIRHDPEPPGLKELTIRRKGKEPLGINICGGVQSPPANPLDRTDEGIFIEEVHKGGAGDKDGRLKAGMRILEVNEVSLLGCTQDDAAKALKNSGPDVRLMICEGFDPSLMSLPSVAVAAAAVAEARAFKDNMSSSKSGEVRPIVSSKPTTPIIQMQRPTPPRQLPISAEVEEEFSRQSPASNQSPSGRRPIIGSAAPRPYKSRQIGPPRPMATTPTDSSFPQSMSSVFSGLSGALSSSGLPTTSGSSQGFFSSTSGLSSPSTAYNDPYISQTDYASSLAATSKSLPSLVVETMKNPPSPRPPISPHLPPVPPPKVSSPKKPNFPAPPPPAAHHPAPPPVAPKPSRPVIGNGSSVASPPQLDSSTEEAPTANLILQSRIPSATSSSKILPPSAHSAHLPSPTSNTNKISMGSPEKESSPGAKPEKLSFGSKLQKFEKEIVEQGPGGPAPAVPSKLPRPPPAVPPKKLALVSENDVKRMKEEQSSKPLPVATPTTPDDNINSFLQSDIAGKPSGPSVVRTKKAENRQKAAQGDEGEEGTDSTVMSPAEKRAKEAEQRRQWRADRLKSLEADALRAENIMKKVLKSSDTIPENECNERDEVVGSEVVETQTKEVDPETGDIIVKTYHHEQTVLKHQTETTERKVLTLPSSTEIGFIDDGSSTKSGAD